MAASSGVWFAFVEFTVFFLTLAICLLLKLDNRQSKPYMDEIFHVPQVQQYCKGNFFEVNLPAIFGLEPLALGLAPRPGLGTLIDTSDRRCVFDDSVMKSEWFVAV